MHQRDLRHLLGILFLGCTLASAPAWASPPDNVWIEDLRLHPSGPAELAITYDYIEPDMDRTNADLDIITLRTASGFDRAPMDFQPSIGLAQGGLGPARLEHVGLRARLRLSGTTGTPKLGLLFGYRLQLFNEHAHDFEQGLAGRLHFGQALALGYEARVRERVGEGGDVEARIGAALSYTMAIGLVSLSLESFALVPLVGQRLTDQGAGGAADQPALYIGPGLRVHLEYLWLDLGAVTGRLLENGADVMVRATLGTQF